MQARLDGQALTITGAANGVGKAIALAAVEAGSSELLLTDVDGDALGAAAAELEGRANIETVTADLAETSAAGAIAEAAVTAFGRIDGLVNAAGLTTRASFLDGTAQMWDRLFAVNARAPFLLMQAAIKDMVRRGEAGAIVNVQSMNAHCGAPDLAIYSSTKGALQTLTKNAANAHLANRIRVNGINLGWTWTESEDRLWREDLGAGDDWAERHGATRPLGRLLNVEEAARQAVFLLSPVSAPMTGVSIDLEQQVVGAPA
jgi:NAD(P)-dependent dehydrogenase (short-subunit alcohol dehydrogenase family)